MDMASTSTARFDPLDPQLSGPETEACERFWSVLLSHQQRCPVWHSEARGGFWTIAGFDNVNQAARDWQTFTSAQGAEAVPLESGDTGFHLIPAEVDPPRHRELRKVLNPPFRIGEVRKHADDVAAIAHALFDDFTDRGSCDFVQQFAGPFPAEVFFRCFLGLSAERSAEVRRMVEDILTDPANAATAFGEFVPWCSDVVDERRSTGRRGDVLDAIVEGVDGGLMSATDQFSAILTIVGAGIETTAMGVANMAMLLATQPSLRQKVRDADPTAVCEEFLRYHAPVPAMGRVTTRDVEVAGQVIPKGARVNLSFGAANRDPGVFKDPDVIDFGRPDLARALTFGIGAHRCLGLHVAMLELEVALSCVLERLPDLRLDPDKPITWRTALTRGPASLPILFTPS